MAESTTKTKESTPQEAPAAAPGLVPGDATVTAEDSKAMQKEAAGHVLDYCDQVETELSTLEDGIKQIRSAAKALKSTPQSGLLDELRDIIFEVWHSVPLLRVGAGPRAHIEHRTLPAPDVNDPNVISATGQEPIL